MPTTGSYLLGLFHLPSYALHVICFRLCISVQIWRTGRLVSSFFLVVASYGWSRRTLVGPSPRECSKNTEYFFTWVVVYAYLSFWFVLGAAFCALIKLRIFALRTQVSWYCVAWMNRIAELFRCLYPIHSLWHIIYSWIQNRVEPVEGLLQCGRGQRMKLQGDCG